MTKTRPWLLACAAFAALSQPTIATAQAGSCLDQDDVADAAIYAMPAIIQSVKGTCGPRLSSRGWLATKGDAYAQRFTAQQAAAWPGTMRTIGALASKSGAGEARQMRTLMATLPPGALRPMVDALIVQELAGEIPVNDCGDIERALELISPLPTQNAGALVGLMLAQVDKRKGELDICSK